MNSTTEPKSQIDYQCPKCGAPEGNLCMADSTDAAGNAKRYPTNPHTARKALWKADR